MNLVCNLCITCNICFLLVLYSSCLAYADQANNSTISAANLSNGTDKEVNHTTRGEANATNPIFVSSEGGNIVSNQHDNTHRSREGKADPIPPVVELTSEPTNDTRQSPVTPVAIPKTQSEPPAPLPVNSINKNNVSNVSEEANVRPIYEIAQKNDGKKSVAKKEPKFDSVEPSPSVTPNVSNNTINQSNTNKTNTINVTAIPTNNTNTTTKSINATVATPTTNATAAKKLDDGPKKPLFTEATDDDYAPSNFVSGAKAEASKNKLSDSVPSLESVEKRKSKKADYVVPIVALILSVPLVTIVMSLMYKRTAEWWHHRHYRRMDFLIEGMYNY